MARPAHHNPRGGFRNPWPGGPPPGHASFFNWLRAHRKLRPFPVDPPASEFEVIHPALASRASDDEVTFTWLGHATYLIQLGATNILTDPVWGKRASPLSFAGPHRHVPAPLQLEDLPPIDIVLISHNHYDHLETATVRSLASRRRETQWVVPLGLGEFVRRRGAEHVHVLDWWDSAGVGDVIITATPAQHLTARTSFDAARTLWCGYGIQRGDTRIYFAGDTAYFPEFPVIGSRLGPFDAAIMPIGAYDPRSFMQYLHMNPEEAVQAFQDLFSRVDVVRTPVLLPMHWGTYKMTIEALDEPPKRLQAAWKAAGLPEAGLHVLRHGETISL